MEVCLVTSPRFNCRPGRKSLPPLGLAYLGAVAREAGHDVTAVEGILIGRPRAIARRVAACEPDVVGTSTVSMDRVAGIRTIRAIRRALPDVFLVVGGSHFTWSARDAMTVVPQIDAVVLGEGEETFIELLGCLPDRRDLGRIKGLMWRDGDGQIHENAPRPIMPDINHLPMPAWDLFGPEQYDFRMVARGHTRAVGAITTRGCPYSCVYCANARPTKVRFIDPVKVVDELLWLSRKHGVQELDIMDDSFLANKKHVIAFCQELLRRDAGFAWWCGARARNLDPDVLRLMKRAGCQAMGFGVETGTDEVLKAANKQATTAEMMEAMHVVAKVGFRRVGVGLIIGLPGETTETIDRTVGFLRRIKEVIGLAWRRKSLIGQLPLIYPGTPLETLAHTQGSLPEDFSWNSPYLEPKRWLPMVNHRYQTVPHFESRQLPLEVLCDHLRKHHWNELAPGRKRRYRAVPWRRFKVGLGLPV